ncbi:MAG: hypothetical protein N3A62_08175 [Thermodesulfovibrionales bacterium]|nr:hypothetical protein [Thermodesulfovibrionales bacterium]
MKRIVLGLVVSVLVLTLINTAQAFGPGGGYGFGNCPRMIGQVPPPQLTPEQVEKHNKFLTDTLPLRQKMMQLKTELAVLYNNPNPDFKAIAEKEKQMVDLRVEMQKKAKESGLPIYPGYGRGGCMGYGPAGGFKAGMGRMGF